MDDDRQASWSPRDVGRALGVGESTVKRWVDAGKLHADVTAGGHRRIAAQEWLRFARGQGLQIVPEHRQEPADDTVWYATCISGDPAGAAALTRRELLAGRTPAEICDGPIRRVLHRVGEQWQHGPQGIAEEHAATLCCIEAVSALRRATAITRPGAPVAIGGTPSGDPYQIPSAMAATVLAALGWRAIDLGAGVPSTTLAASVRKHGARLVWRSCSSPAPGDDPAELLAAVRETGAVLVVGGRCSPNPSHLPGALMAESMVDLETLARSIEGTP